MSKDSESPLELTMQQGDSIFKGEKIVAIRVTGRLNVDKLVIRSMGREVAINSLTRVFTESFSEQVAKQIDEILAQSDELVEP